MTGDSVALSGCAGAGRPGRGAADFDSTGGAGEFAAAPESEAARFGAAFFATTSSGAVRFGASCWATLGAAVVAFDTGSPSAIAVARRTSKRGPEAEFGSGPASVVSVNQITEPATEPSTTSSSTKGRRTPLIVGLVVGDATAGSADFDARHRRPSRLRRQLTFRVR